MMEGAFESESTMYSFIPEHVPKPVAYGSYKSRPDIHFYIAEFVEMDDLHPDASGWATVISNLHKRSRGKAPGGNFGFHRNGHLANISVDYTPNPSWEKFWAQQLRSLCEEEERRREQPDEAWTRLKQVFFDLVIPRYIRPLESNGRSVQPTLVHNDAWPGNIKPRTGSPDALCLFDAACYWGHNEGGDAPLYQLLFSLCFMLTLVTTVDLRACCPGVWGLEKAGEAYSEIMGISEPQEELSIRIELYAVVGFVLRSAMYNKEPKRRIM